MEQLDFDTEKRQFYNELEFRSCEKFMCNMCLVYVIDRHDLLKYVQEYERKNLLREKYMNILVL